MLRAADRELAQRVFHLQALHDVSRELAPLQDPDALLSVAAMALSGALGAAMAVAVARRGRTADAGVSHALGLTREVATDLAACPDFAEGVRTVASLQGPFRGRLQRAGLQVWMGLELEDGLAAGLGLGPRLTADRYGAGDLQFLETVRLMVRQALVNGQLLAALRAANAQLAQENRQLEEQVQDSTETLSAAFRALSRDAQTAPFIGESAALRQVYVQLEQVAPTELTLLIQGETGTGKSMVARLVHQLSPRREAPFVQVNCGSLPPSLVESELFGHERGAFTGATARRLGKVELSRDGTLFLDEIGDMPHETQVKLLRLLEERVFERVGGSRTLASRARVIAATHRDLEQLVRAGTFREDLYFRLRVFPVRLPPLRERRADIVPLARSAVTRFSQRIGRPAPEIGPEVLGRLQELPWPGNVRELEHLMQRAVLVCQGQRIQPGDLDPGGAVAPTGSGAAFLSLADNEKRHIQRALEATGGVVFGERGAARLLGVNPQTLRYRIRKHGLTRPT